MLGEYPDGDAPALPVEQKEVFIADFSQPNPIVNDAATTDHSKFLWNQYPYGVLGGGHEDNGEIVFDTEIKLGPVRSLAVQLEVGTAISGFAAVYMQYYTHGVVAWQFMRDIVDADVNLTAWEVGVYNRYEYYIHVPAETTLRDPGQYNYATGTYLSNGTNLSGSAESGGGHFYHRFNLFPGWNKVLVDTHPTHKRGAPGADEQFNQPNPAGVAGQTYFDSVTRIYHDFEDGNMTADGTRFQFDLPRMYEESRPEEEEKIYSLNANYVQSTNQLNIGWNRNKDDNAITNEVRYSFQDIHSIGWDSATPAPNGILSPPGFQGYNGGQYRNSSINMGANPVIYVAIKSTGQPLFKQIKVELTL